MGICAMQILFSIDFGGYIYCVFLILIIWLIVEAVEHDISNTEVMDLLTLNAV